MICEILDLGLTTYDAAEAIQLKTLGEVKAGIKKAGLIFSEFLPVYTIGRSGSSENILVSRESLDRQGIRVLKINRGGNITLHNPRQLVAYPIFNLAFLKKDLNWYLRSLEEVVINTLSGYGIYPRRKKGYTGVWVGDGKVASIGIAVSRWVTYHGLAVNVSNDLSYFEYINPCGIKDCRMTSVSKLTGRIIDIEDVKTKMIKEFELVFGVKIDAGIDAKAAVA